MKVIRFNTPKGQFYIPLLKIAKNRANHYLPSAEGNNYQEEVDFVMNDDFEGIDWLLNNSNFEDWKDIAVKLNNEVKVLEDDFWCSSDDFEIVEIEVKEEDPIKKVITANVKDLVLDFYYYDRKDDDDLSQEQLVNAINNKIITIDEIVDCFRNELEKL